MRKSGLDFVFAHVLNIVVKIYYKCLNYCEQQNVQEKNAYTQQAAKKQRPVHATHRRRDEKWKKKHSGLFFLQYLCQQRLVLIFSHVFCFAARCCRCCSKIKRCETGPLVYGHTPTLFGYVSTSCVFDRLCLCVCVSIRIAATAHNATIIITATSLPSDKLSVRMHERKGDRFRWIQCLNCND